MRVLVIYNFFGCRLGLIGTALEELGAEIDLVRVDEGAPLPDAPEGYDGIVVLGGVQNALADDTCPWLPDLARLMREFGESGRAVLGVCLGSQLLARAYGGDNIIGGASEFGWQTVNLTDEGVEDPIFAGVPRSFPTFQWHDDSFTIPPGGTHLATNDAVRNQGFRIGKRAYGLQFHFEAERPVVEDWNDIFAELLATSHPSWMERYPEEADRHGPASEAAGLTIARNWLRIAAGA